MSPTEAKKILDAVFKLSRAESEMREAELKDVTEDQKSALRRRHLKKAAVLRELIRAATHE